VRTTPVPLDQVPPDEQQKWLALGVTLVPPTGYLQQVRLNAEVINHSGGKVDDATARKWAEALQRVYGWDSWAIDNLQSFLFAKLAPDDSFTQRTVFGPDYGYVREAVESHGRLSGENARLSKMVLVPVTPDTKSRLTGTYGYPTPLPDWAFVVTQSGPITVVLKTSDGQQRKLLDLPGSYREDVFVIGEPRDYPTTLGMIWFSHSFLGCEKNDFLRASCAS
jgi:hypothetical protein